MRIIQDYDLFKYHVFVNTIEKPTETREPVNRRSVNIGAVD